MSSLTTSSSHSGRIFLITTSTSQEKDAIQTLKNFILNRGGWEPKEIRIGDKRHLRSALEKLLPSNKILQTPSIFINSEYFGTLEEMEQYSRENDLKQTLLNAKQQDPGPVYSIFRNQNDIVALYPSKLYFPPSDGSKVIAHILKLSNLSDTNYVVFKMKTNNSKPYSVNPKQGVIRPGEQINITIHLKEKMSASVNDKFRLEGVVIPYADESFSVEIDKIFEKLKDRIVKQTVPLDLENCHENVVVEDRGDMIFVEWKFPEASPSTNVNEEIIPETTAPDSQSITQDIQRSQNAPSVQGVPSTQTISAPDVESISKEPEKSKSQPEKTDNSVVSESSDSISQGTEQQSVGTEEKVVPPPVSIPPSQPSQPSPSAQSPHSPELSSQFTSTSQSITTSIAESVAPTQEEPKTVDSSQISKEETAPQINESPESDSQVEKEEQTLHQLSASTLLEVISRDANIDESLNSSKSENENIQKDHVKEDSQKESRKEVEKHETKKEDEYLKKSEVSEKKESKAESAKPVDTKRTLLKEVEKDLAKDLLKDLGRDANIVATIDKKGSQEIVKSVENTISTIPFGTGLQTALPLWIVIIVAIISFILGNLLS